MKNRNPQSFTEWPGGFVPGDTVIAMYGPIHRGHKGRVVHPSMIGEPKHGQVPVVFKPQGRCHWFAPHQIRKEGEVAMPLTDRIKRLADKCEEERRLSTDDDEQLLEDIEICIGALTKLMGECDSLMVMVQGIQRTLTTGGPR